MLPPSPQKKLSLRKIHFLNGMIFLGTSIWFSFKFCFLGEGRGRDESHGRDAQPGAGQIQAHQG